MKPLSSLDVAEVLRLAVGDFSYVSWAPVRRVTVRIERHRIRVEWVR